MSFVCTDFASSKDALRPCATPSSQICTHRRLLEPCWAFGGERSCFLETNTTAPRARWPWLMLPPKLCIKGTKDGGAIALQSCHCSMRQSLTPTQSIRPSPPGRQALRQCHICPVIGWEGPASAASVQLCVCVCVCQPHEREPLSMISRDGHRRSLLVLVLAQLTLLHKLATTPPVG